MNSAAELGNAAFSWYQACLFLGFSTSVVLLLAANKRLSSPLRMGPLIIVPLYLAALCGAKLMFLILPENTPQSARVFSLWRGGYWYHGGLFGGIVAFVLYHAIKRNNIIDACDLAFPFVCLGEAITRFGCYIEGCCWGVPVVNFPGIVAARESHPWLQQIQAGFISEDAAYSLPIHPVQLYMTLSLTALFVTLRLAATRQVVRGEITLLFLVGHCFIRFWLEFFRGDIVTHIYGLSPTQWGSIVAYLLSLSALVFLYRRKCVSQAGLRLGTEAMSCG